MYLNLDLLHVVDNYTFPLFYYGVEFDNYIYSPMTFKSVHKFVWVEHIDHITLMAKYYMSPFKESVFMLQKNTIYFTEKHVFRSGCLKMNKTEPFNMDKYSKTFLESNKRINKK